MKIKTITFNVNNTPEAIKELEALCSIDYDIILISIQEYHWIAFKKIKFKGFVNQESVNVWGTVCVILSNESLSVQYKRVCLGSFNLGNKGYILSLINNSFVFVSVHLTHGQKNKKKRKEELKLILEEINSIGVDIPFIIAGDLNFRMECAVSNYNERYDQLVEVKEELGFLEYKIEFQPTYKFKAKTNHFDKNRIPSYCDRILFRGVLPSIYNSVSHITISDHKPVFMITKRLNIRKGDFSPPPLCLLSEISCFVFNHFYVVIFMLLLLFFYFIFK